MTSPDVPEAAPPNQNSPSACPPPTALTKPLIHIGYHKTGSSWLQKHLLRNEEAGFYSPWTPVSYIERFVITNPFTYDRETTAAEFQPEFDLAVERGLVPTITHEMLSGNPWKGTYPSKETAERLRATFEQGRVLIVIREQVSMISSLYRHHVRTGLAVSLKRYLQRSVQGAGWEPFFQREYLAYHQLIGHYQNIFGNANVLVLPFELILQDAEEFVRRIAEFSGCLKHTPIQVESENTGYCAAVTELKRRVNPLMRADLPIGRVPFRHRIGEAFFYRLNHFWPKDAAKQSNEQMKRQIAQTLGDEYAVSNERTAEMTGLDLRAFGYRMP